MNIATVLANRCQRDIMGVSWRDHMTNEELLLRAGVGDPQDIVATRRRRFMYCASRRQDQPA